eukprot:TRINITY_DN7125_c0_g2_i3.p1 TRINITY_DN7125_c0_g2~~TRINITY_DN7125_c0_g2_i3.p1  ORF type:complete len:123 (+),score=3.27 TRINITY_DN7125_c0_g2_i3:237-605(+)
MSSVIPPWCLSIQQPFSPFMSVVQPWPASSFVLIVHHLLHPFSLAVSVDLCICGHIVTHTLRAFCSSFLSTPTPLPSLHCIIIISMVPVLSELLLAHTLGQCDNETLTDLNVLTLSITTQTM